ncbi:hypothetical protein Psi01_69060 [Planobispora siamensis]|uniref:Anti-sigma factor antagonist n=2 Tax=Planobispora siamensis TaxID=936338 RepID=A0A8J3SPE2_9ACTN|nr:hypothetical protein Psi01_69060 [Planobispora siamensis]
MKLRHTRSIPQHVPLMMSDHADTTGDAVVTVRGEIDITTAPLLEAHIRRTLLTRRRPADIVLDLRGVTFMDASGLTALVHIDDHARRNGHGIRLAGVSCPVARLLRITRLDRRFTASCRP